MRLASIRKEDSPDTPGFVRLTGVVERESGETFDIWYEVPSALQADLSESANPWLVAMLPYALPNGEAIVADLPADAVLLENLKGLTAIWCDWYHQYLPPAIRAPVAPLPLNEPSTPQSAAFFSGGVDSWFTVLRHAPEREPSAIGRVDELITVHGFDIPLESPDEFAAQIGHRPIQAAARTPCAVPAVSGRWSAWRMAWETFLWHGDLDRAYTNGA